MRIQVKYESSWRNSFLSGSNNEPLPKDGRKFIGSITSLKNKDNFIQRSISKDTVMGILNRLIGDQRKLYQSRNSEQYYFQDIEPLMSFQDIPNHISQEMTFIRNISGSEDQNSYTGMIQIDDPIFCSDYSQSLWGVLNLTIDELCQFIVNENQVTASIEHHPLVIMGRMEEINKLKPVAKEGAVDEAFKYLKDRFSKFSGLNNKQEVILISLYCSALYLQLERLSLKFDVSSAKTKQGGLSGISNNGFTKKDFMSRYTSGQKKKIWGNPYIRKEKIKGVGEVVSLMEKAGGTLIIELNIDQDTAKDLFTKIENAGVSSFYVGKKGLAYVSDIRL